MGLVFVSHKGTKIPRVWRHTGSIRFVPSCETPSAIHTESRRGRLQIRHCHLRFSTHNDRLKQQDGSSFPRRVAARQLVRTVTRSHF